MESKELLPCPTELLEILASIEHDRWSNWMKYQFSKGKLNSGDWVIPVDRVDWWKKLWNTPYSELSEKSKESDRIEVRRTWEAIQLWNTRAPRQELRALDEEKLIHAAQKFCRKEYPPEDMPKEEYHEKFGVLICFIKDALIKEFGQPKAEIPSVEELSKIKLPYPATFTQANPDGVEQKFHETTLSYEAAQAIHDEMVRVNFR